MAEPPARYRKKPTTIEAVQYDETNLDELVVWSGGVVEPLGPTTDVVVNTPTGDSILRLRDWLARQPLPGGKWDYWPIAQQQFAATYFPVGADEEQPAPTPDHQSVKTGDVVFVVLILLAMGVLVGVGVVAAFG